MDILFIVNPTAGKGKGNWVAAKIKEHMDLFNIPYEIKITTRKREGEDIARDGAQKGYKKIVAVGGDGTLYEVLNGIMGYDVSLGVIPTGTGNDFARTVGIPLNIKEAIETIIEGENQSIDCGKARDRYFLNVGSIGLDAEIVKETEELKNVISGPWAYIGGLFKTIIKFKSKRIEIHIDGERLDNEVMLVAVANGKYYGGGMKIAPRAKINDGFFEMCIINRMSKIKLMFLFPTIFSGKHIHMKEVSLFKGKEIKIISEKPLMINLDGDIIGEGPVTFKIIPMAIRVTVPKQ